MRITIPANDARFTIPVSTDSPAVDFQNDATGPHYWDWKIQWRHFHRSGQAATADNRWSATAIIKNLGGTLTVYVRTDTPGVVPKSMPHNKPHPLVGIQVKIIGSNSNVSDVDVYLSSKPDSSGFGAILAHETKDRHFNGFGNRSYRSTVVMAFAS